MPERIIETRPEALLDDNVSSLAQERLVTWQNAADSKELIVVFACSDSRLVLPFESSIHIYSLSAGGPRSPFIDLLKNRRVKGAAIVCHHDGYDVVPGRCPNGCGARDVKEQILSRDTRFIVNRPNRVEKFIEDHVWHSDLVLQLNAAGGFTAHRSGKDTIALTQNNRDLLMTPLFVFTDGGLDSRACVPQHLLVADKYFPGEIYKNGLPELPKEKIPETFSKFLKENEAQAKSLALKYRNLPELQSNQNPSLLVLSTDPRPLRVRYPQTTEVPGSVFRISVPLQNIDGNRLINPEHLVTCLQQADYPVGHFSNLRTILIETRSMDKSENVANSFIQQVWIQNWLKDPEHQVLVGEVERGRAKKISRFKF